MFYRLVLNVKILLKTHKFQGQMQYDYKMQTLMQKVSHRSIKPMHLPLGREFIIIIISVALKAKMISNCTIMVHKKYC